MTVLIPSHDVSWVTPLQKEQVQPAGIDLTVHSIFTCEGEGTLSKEGKLLPQTKEIPLHENFFELTPGTYLIRYTEKVSVPPNAIGLVFPRSSLLRMGGNIDTAVWDPGYTGIGMSRLTIAIPTRIERGARIAQIVFLKTETQPRKLYNGSYQGEGLTP